MTEHPILFSAEMVRAILRGDKTQTRRAIKPQPPAEAESVSRQLCSQQIPEFDGAWQWWAGKPQTPITKPLFCPYGAPGDTLWVRETWAPHPHGVMRCGAVYRADPDAVPDAGRWRPSIHMPRWASRITLRITAVCVERLQDISEDDAIAEGVALERYVPISDSAGKHASGEAEPTDPVAEYRDLWNRINGAGAWDYNPWVWALSFERVKP